MKLLRNIKVWFFLGLLGFSLPLVALPHEAMQESIVRIFSHIQKTRQRTPWEREESVERRFLGVVVQHSDRKLILTCADVAIDARYIEMRTMTSNVSYALIPFFVDREIGLALFEAEDSALENLPAVSLAQGLSLRQKVSLYSRNQEEKLTEVTGQVSDMTVLSTALSDYPRRLALAQFDKQYIKMGDPVYVGRSFAGFVVNRDPELVQVIPIEHIRHFLTDQHDGSYRGFPSLGISTNELLSKEFRKYLQAEGESRGVRIAKVHQTSPFLSDLKKDDILLRIDDFAIDERGFVDHPRFGKIRYQGVLGDYFGGDEIEMEVLRLGKKIRVKRPVQRFDSNRRLIPFFNLGGRVDFVIFSGFVFQNLTREYLQSWGRDQAPLLLRQRYKFENPYLEYAERSLLIVSQVLADPQLSGYNGAGNLLVQKVNGRPVSSLYELRQALSTPLRKQGEDFVVLEFHPSQGSAILPYKDVAAIHQRISRLYSIAETYFYLPENTGKK